MRVTFWGTRGSIATVTSDTQIYGGNTPCVTIEQDDTLLILDAGSGIRVLGASGLVDQYKDVHILLTHLHMDHIQGLGFFRPFFTRGKEINLWGPAGSSSLEIRLNRYLSPPLFPVRMRDFTCDFHLHETPMKPFILEPFLIKGTYVCHPGPTLGYRVTNTNSVVTYIPDHEPALGQEEFPGAPEWTSGYSLAWHSDLLIHDGQFTKEEYRSRQGWGHSAVPDTLKFAQLANVDRLSLFHHDPGHSDEELERYFGEYVNGAYPFDVDLAREGQTIELS